MTPHTVRAPALPAPRGAPALALALALALLLPGCAAPESGDGTFAMYVKDQPTDEFAEIWVRFRSVDLVGGDGRVEVWNGSKELDLRALNDSEARGILGAGDVPAGNYSQVRLRIDEAWGVREDGSREDFRVPSGVLRIHQRFDVDAGGNTTMTADFDLDGSIVRAGGSGMWLMRPVLHRVMVKEGDAPERVDEDPDVE